ncbi:RNase P subunit p30 family protein [Halobacteriales archaeon Cl-PHB]
MYEAVHARPDGPSTVARLATTAGEFGFDGIVVRNHGDQPASYDPAAISDAYDVDVVTAVEVRAEDPSRASGFVGNHRTANTVVCVHGGQDDINRFAVEQPAVDVLAHPMADDGDVNHVLAKEAAANGVRLEVALGPVLRQNGGQRVQAIRDLRKLRELIAAYDAPYVVSADPSSHLQLRAPRELAALGEQLGFDADQIESGLAEWGRLAERNRHRQSDAFVEPGVTRDVEDESG